jgi:phage baseplate assembly protein W
LQIGYVGYDPLGKLCIGLGDSIPLRLEASNPRPRTYQLTDQTIEHQANYGFQFGHLGVDDSGTQSVADILEVETGSKVFRVNFGSKASELPVSIANRNPAHTVYADRSTEYYFALAEYGQRGQIRGLPPDAAHEFCQRRLAEGKRPKRLESKKVLKLRIKRSPDHADAVACLIGVAREVLGITPGATQFSPQGTTAPTSTSNAQYEQLALMYDLDGRSGNYMAPIDYRNSP